MKEREKQKYKRKERENKTKSENRGKMLRKDLIKDLFHQMTCVTI